MDNLSKVTRSKIMSSIRSKNTKPELAVRKVLFAMGYRYHLHYGKYKIDIAIPSKKVAIFVDGCFWHMCPRHSRIPASNVVFWRMKLLANVKRDKEVNIALKNDGWKVIRIWEHNIKSKKGLDTVKCTLKSHLV